MTQAKLDEGYRLLNMIEGRKLDILRLTEYRFIASHSCSGKLTEEEQGLNEKIRAYALKVANEELKRLETAFTKL